MNFVRTITLMALLALVLPVHSNFSQAMRDYESGDLERAHHALLDMAEMGYYRAQYNLGMMYLRGEHPAGNRALGYAWLNLSRGRIARLDDQIEALWLKADVQIRDEALVQTELLKLRFGRESLQRTLLPGRERNETCDSEPTITRQVKPRYPRIAVEAKTMGAVTVVFDVDEAGGTYNAGILLGPEVFHGPTLTALKQFRFRGGEASGLLRQFTFEIKPSGRYELNSENMGFTYYHPAVLGRLPDHLRPEQTVLNDYVIDAAQQRLSAAQYLVGRNLLLNTFCGEESTKAIAWLRRAVEGEYLPANVLLARSAGETGEAVRLLEQAMEYPPARLELAWLLATTSTGHRDPRRSLSLIEEMDSSNLRVAETRAASLAAAGDFRGAVRQQKRVVRKAGDRSTEAMEKRLEAYRNNQAWLAP